ncbi:MAG: response regulator transcription factor [Campylobacterales bacterium]|nr:response regulator transcription factor [Campylobacterales bacterium]
MKPVLQKILIVDDDDETRLLVARVLVKLSFVELLEADSGEKAVQIARAEEPNIILMDILMPGMDGYEACRRIKSEPRLADTIVIFMSAVNKTEIDDKMIQVGGDDVLRKPVDASELYFRVRNYLLNQDGTIDLGKGLHYLVNGKSLYKNNRLIPLMLQEVLLLEALIHYKNRVVPYDQLLQIISKNGDSTIANLRTLIKLLRAKTYKELIKTYSSIGYQLVL